MTEDSGTTRGGFPRRQLGDEVAGYVRDLIMSGQLRSGDFIRQERIADELGLSATPVREGLLSLRGEGFVQLVPRRGFVVAPLSASDVRDLFTAQALIAGELVSRAAARMDAAELREITGIHHALRKAATAGDGSSPATQMTPLRTSTPTFGIVRRIVAASGKASRRRASGVAARTETISLASCRDGATTSRAAGLTARISASARRATSSLESASPPSSSASAAARPEPESEKSIPSTCPASPRASAAAMLPDPMKPMTISPD